MGQKLETVDTTVHLLPAGRTRGKSVAAPLRRPLLLGIELERV